MREAVVLLHALLDLGPQAERSSTSMCTHPIARAWAMSRDTVDRETDLLGTGRS